MGVTAGIMTTAFYRPGQKAASRLGTGLILLDHLIRLPQERRRDREAEDLGGLEVLDGFRAAPDDGEHGRAVLGRDGMDAAVRTVVHVSGRHDT